MSRCFQVCGFFIIEESYVHSLFSKYIVLEDCLPYRKVDFLYLLSRMYDSGYTCSVVTSVNHTSTRSKRNSRFPCSRREHGVNKSDLCLTCGGFI